jgi:molybdate transport system substrate-binding protein
MRLATAAFISATTMFTLSPAAQQQPAPAIAVLASGAVEGSIAALKSTLPPASSRFETSQGLADRLSSGEAPDVLIAQAAMIEGLVNNGRAIADSRQPLGRIPIGVAAAAGAARPDVTTVDALKTAILAADAIVISRGASGTLLENTFRDLGIADRVEAKIRRESRGDDVMKTLGESRANAIGFTMVSEIKYGERYGGRYVGLLPDALQRYTSYDAVVLTASRRPDAARAFVRALVAPEAQRVFAQNGWLRP